MLPSSIAHLARVECLAQDLDYETFLSSEPGVDLFFAADERDRPDRDRLFDELVEYVAELDELTDAEREELLRKIEDIREAEDG